MDLSTISLRLTVFYTYISIKVRRTYSNLIISYYSTFASGGVFFKQARLKCLLWNDTRKYLMKKYCYTVNHKRLGLNYFYFSLWTALSGSLLATMIRLEMAYPGSPFFKGDSLRYLQVMSAHALIMIFFVVIPIFFGGFANFLLPYHVGSKDVAFPRLNSIGFWIQPCGYLLIAKIGFMRQQYWHYYDKMSFYTPTTSLNKFLTSLEDDWETNEVFNYVEPLHLSSKYVDCQEKYFAYIFELEPRLKKHKSRIVRPDYWDTDLHVTWSGRLSSREARAGLSVAKEAEAEINVAERLGFEATPDFFHFFSDPLQTNMQKVEALVTSTAKTFLPIKLFFWENVFLYPERLWYVARRASKLRRQKRYVAKCSSATQTVAGWTFITPFSSDLRFTGFGVQDMLILGVIFAGISTTISVTNLLITRRTLGMPGLRTRRVLLPFISITILLMLRVLAVITPILGSAMIMLLADRHWDTSFFEFSEGGDPVLFHHLFWFFGHPEVYVLVIPGFGVINSVIPQNTTRRVASKHHLIWAVYIMTYMGFFVWGHHMYLIGLDHRSRALYSTFTIMISLPATIKVVNWTLSLMNGALRVDPTTAAVVSFIFFFLVAGFTGMWLSHVSLNISMHDTLYVVAHFHLMLSGSVLMAIFAGFYFYFFVFFGVRYSKTWAYLHLLYYTAGQWMTFIPLFWVSFSGLPRRLHDFPAVFSGWQSMATAGHFVTMVGVCCFYVMLFDAHRAGKTQITPTLLLPRFSKRVLYYIYKIAQLQLYKQTFKSIPGKDSRQALLTHLQFVHY